MYWKSRIILIEETLLSDGIKNLGKSSNVLRVVITLKPNRCFGITGTLYIILFVIMTNQKRISLSSPDDAYRFLGELGAPGRLILHSQLVYEVAEKLAEQISNLGVTINKPLVLLGATLHDAGKIRHPEELEGSGNRHEEAGESLLVKYGIAPDIARCCRTHGQWHTMNCSLEEYLIAISDTIWKGKRDSELEKRIADIITERTGRDKWEILIELDTLFESIAAEGSARLMRSQ